MSGVGFDPVELLGLLRTSLAILLMGGVIKLMDDFLDLRYDVFEGSETLAVRLGEGTLPYALLGFTLAVLSEPTLAAALMVGAYSVGMAGDYDRQLPSGLYGYQESLLVLLIGMSSAPWSTVAWAATVMLSVQIADDLNDLAPDRRSGNPNLARRFGIVESRMVGLAALLIACMLRPVSTALIFITVPVISWGSRAVARPINRTRGWVR